MQKFTPAVSREIEAAKADTAVRNAGAFLIGKSGASYVFMPRVPNAIATATGVTVFGLLVNGEWVLTTDREEAAAIAEDMPRFRFEVYPVGSEDVIEVVARSHSEAIRTAMEQNGFTKGAQRVEQKERAVEGDRFELRTFEVIAVNTGKPVTLYGAYDKLTDRFPNGGFLNVAFAARDVERMNATPADELPLVTITPVVTIPGRRETEDPRTVETVTELPGGAVVLRHGWHQYETGSEWFKEIHAHYVSWAVDKSLAAFCDWYYAQYYHRLEVLREDGPQDPAPAVDVQDGEGPIVDRYVASPYSYYGDSSRARSWSIWDRKIGGWMPGANGVIVATKADAERVARKLNDPDGPVDHGAQPSDDVEQYAPIFQVDFAEVEARVMASLPPLTDGDPVHYRFTNMEGYASTWQPAIFAGESRLTWLLLDDDGTLLTCQKDRVEVRRTPVDFKEGGRG